MIGEEQIRQNAEAALSRFKSLSNIGAEFEYDRESVACVEKFIEQQRGRTNTSETERDALVQLIGSHLGECVIRTYGGVWRMHDGEWGVFFNNLNAAFPFHKVRKQFNNGVGGGDSILSFFDVIGLVIIKKK